MIVRMVIGRSLGFVPIVTVACSIVGCFPRFAYTKRIGKLAHVIATARARERYALVERIGERVERKEQTDTFPLGDLVVRYFHRYVPVFGFARFNVSRHIASPSRPLSRSSAV